MGDEVDAVRRNSEIEAVRAGASDLARISRTLMAPTPEIPRSDVLSTSDSTWQIVRCGVSNDRYEYLWHSNMPGRSFSLGGTVVYDLRNSVPRDECFLYIMLESILVTVETPSLCLTV